MANFYKILDNAKDVVSTRTLLHEAIPLTGTIVSGTYADENIKNYSHGMFQSVCDYPYLSSSANHIFDIAIGVGTESGIYSSVANQQSKQIKLLIIQHYKKRTPHPDKSHEIKLQLWLIDKLKFF